MVCYWISVRGRSFSKPRRSTHERHSFSRGATLVPSLRVSSIRMVRIPVHSRKSARNLRTLSLSRGEFREWEIEQNFQMTSLPRVCAVEGANSISTESSRDSQSEERRGDGIFHSTQVKLFRTQRMLSLNFSYDKEVATDGGREVDSERVRARSSPTPAAAALQLHHFRVNSIADSSPPAQLHMYICACWWTVVQVIQVLALFLIDSISLSEPFGIKNNEKCKKHSYFNLERFHVLMRLSVCNVHFIFVNL